MQGLLQVAGSLIHQGSIQEGVASSLTFAQGQYVGAVTAFLAGIARDGWEDSLQYQLYDAMFFLCKMLSNPKPRVVSVHDCETPVVLFTDGAWEPTSDRPAGAGWVIVDQVSDTRLVLSWKSPAALLEFGRSRAGRSS